MKRIKKKHILPPLFVLTIQATYVEICDGMLCLMNAYPEFFAANAWWLKYVITPFAYAIRFIGGDFA